jgi:V/A-type H+-transporting ATPase subunit C
VGLPRDLLDLYLKKFVIYNIMTIVKGKIAKMPEEEIEESLIPVGYEYDFYKSLLTKDIEEVSRVLEGTPFHEPLSRMTPDNLGEIEDEIYKVYYSRLATLPSVDPTIIPFTLFIRKEIDIKNIKTILRLRLEEASVDEILPRIIQTGYEITLDEARKLASMSWDELTRSLEGYWFGKELEGIEEKSLSRIEVKFDRAWIKLIAKIASNYPLSILPILQYITLKKVEVDNLRIIGWGKWNNIPNEAIEEQLVLVG